MESCGSLLNLLVTTAEYRALEFTQESNAEQDWSPLPVTLLYSHAHKKDVGF